MPPSHRRDVRRSTAKTSCRPGPGDQPEDAGPGRTAGEPGPGKPAGDCRIIRRIAKETGAASFVVAHDVNHSHRYRPGVYIAHGHVAVGTPAEVITSETLSKLYNSPVKYCEPATAALSWSGRQGECISYHGAPLNHAGPEHMSRMYRLCFTIISCRTRSSPAR